MEDSSDPPMQRTIAEGPGEPPPSDDLPVGPEIGRYLVIDEIGAGGMGRVFRAYDPKLGREVALKRLKLRAGHGTNEGARMLREANAMAQLAHPNVVSIFDVDIDAGSLFIAMEYVRGPTLATWLAQRDHDWREILDMFVQAGRGLASAHAQGIVHRDFKPSNVVIGDDGRPRVTDFGLARAAGGASESGGFESVPAALSHGPELAAFDSHGAGRNLGATLTAFGTVVGTPPYMAPEQHLGDPIDARTDQYAFCVALWEAVHRRPAFVGRDVSTLAAAKLVGPPKPPVGTHVPAAIHTILARGLARDAEQRWPDMATLLDALGEQSGGRKWRWPLVAAVAVATATAGAVYARSDDPCSRGTTELENVWGTAPRAQVELALRSTQASFAESTLARVLASLDGYAHEWVAMHEDACAATEIRHEQSDEALDLRMGCLRARKQELADAVAMLAAADVEITENAIEIASGFTPIVQCADVASLRDRMPPPEVQADVERAREQIDQARLHSRAGRLEQALPLAENARADADATGYLPVVAEAEVRLAIVLGELDRDAEAEPMLEHALDTALAERRNHTAAAAAVELTSLLARNRGRAEQWLARTALGLAEGDGTDPRLIAHAMLVYGNAFADRELELEALPYFEGAVAKLEVAFGPEHPDLVGPLLAYARLVDELKRVDEADALSRRALAIAEAAFGPDHPEVADALHQLGWGAMGAGRFAEALAHFDRALAIVEAAFGPNHGEVWSALGMRATALTELGRYDEAVASIEESLRRMSTTLPEVHPARASSMHNLATVYAKSGNYARAVEIQRDAVRLRREIGHLSTLGAGLGALGKHLTELGRYDEAEQALREAAIVEAQSHADDGAYSAYSHVALAQTIHRRGDLPRARTLLEDVLARASKGTDADSRAEGEFLLGRVLWDLGESRPRAVELVESALAHMQDRPGRLVEAEAMRTWLDQHMVTAPESELVAADPTAKPPR